MKSPLVPFVAAAGIFLALVHVGTPRAADARCWYCDWNGNYCTVDSSGRGGYENCDIGCDFSGPKCLIGVANALNVEVRETKEGRVLAGFSPFDDAFSVLTCTAEVEQVVYTGDGATYRRAVAAQISLT